MRSDADAKGVDRHEPGRDLDADRSLVSVVVPTRNSQRYLTQCLGSIRAQTYRPLEIIVVDNFSIDSTPDIGIRLADKVYQAGPERSAQVNFGVRAARGLYVFRVDSDFRLDRCVIAECVDLCKSGAGAVVVHNTPDDTVGLLARVRKFEVDMYKFSPDHTAARFTTRETYLAIGGLREDLVAGEDYDFQNRLNKVGVLTLTATSEAVHLDEPTRLLPLLRKYFDYGRDFRNYRRYNRHESWRQLAFLRHDYLRNWRKFIREPGIGALFVGYHTVKFIAGGIGYGVGVAELWVNGRCAVTAPERSGPKP